MAIGSFDRSGAVGQVVLTVLFSGERAGGEGVVRPEGDGREGGEARAGHCGTLCIALNQLQSESTQTTSNGLLVLGGCRASRTTAVADGQMGQFASALRAEKQHRL